MDNTIRFAVVGTEGIGVSHIKGIHNKPETGKPVAPHYFA